MNTGNKARRKSMKRTTRKRIFITLLLIPGIVLFTLIYAYPLINIFATSFMKWDSSNLANPTFLERGHLFDNYIKLFTDDYYFKTALFNSLKWVGLCAVIQVPFAIIVALVLSKKPRGWKLVRNAYIIPNIISSAAIGLIFLNAYDPSRGFVTSIIKLFNPDSDINLLANPTQAFWGITFAFILFGGSISLLFLSQIMSISPELFEAAKCDGATSLQTDLRITLPLLRGSIGTILILSCNYGLIMYNEVALISSGGPDGSTYSLSYYIYKTSVGSTKLNFALANSAGVILFIVGILVVGIINLVFQTGSSQSN